MAISGETPTDTTRDNRSERSAGGEYLILEQALWKQFREASSPEDFAQAWLALQCRFVKGAQSAVLVLGELDHGPYVPMAYWPEDGAASAELSAAAELALNERRGAVSGTDERAESSCVAYPIQVDGRLLGVIAVEVRGDGNAHLRNVMRQLQWGSAWIELLFHREQTQSDQEQQERSAIAFDMVATALAHERFNDACSAVVTELATRLDCDQVSIGFVHRGRAVVTSVSHAAEFGRRMNLIRDIGTAMDEAIDQSAIVAYPPHEDWDYQVTRAHAELAQAHQAGAILTVPLHCSGSIIGALTLERPSNADIDEAFVELCDCIGSVLGPVLDAKRRNDRLLALKIVESARLQFERFVGPGYFGRKLATTGLLALVVFFSFATGTYRVTSPALLEGRIQRTVVAPFDGFLASQHLRAGDIVREGDVLATLDSEDLTLERLRLSTRRRQHLIEYDRALARGQRGEANIVQAQIAQADAQIALIDEQLARVRITAPFDGIVVAGDLTQDIGRVVQRGEELFKIAPLDAYRVILEVDERDIGSIRAGQGGLLLMSSMPEQPLTFTVERPTPISMQQDGRNFFRVEAELHDPNERLRPGMKGVAKTEVERRLLIRIWSERLIDWMRMAIWKWMP